MNIYLSAVGSGTQQGVVEQHLFLTFREPICGFLLQESFLDLRGGLLGVP